MDIKTGDRLQQLRKLNGYSQDALAEKLGLSRQAISKWERGESSPDTDNLIALASIYSMTLDELLNSEEEQKTPPIKNEEVKTDEIETTEPIKAKKHSLHSKLGKKLVKFPFPIFVILIFVIFGMLKHDWHPLWIMLFAIPIYYHFAGACFAKTHRGFLMAMPLPEIIVVLFLLLGFVWSAWKMAWILFLVIPIYYWAVASYVKAPKE